MRKPACTPSIFLDIDAKKTQVSASKSNTACTTAQQNFSDTRGSAPYLLSSLPIWLHNRRAFPTLQKTSDQSLSNRSNIRPIHLKVSTPSMHSSSSFPVKLKDASAPWLAIATSLPCHRICMFLSHLRVLWCLISRPDGMFIPHKSQQGIGYLPSCTTAICEKNVCT